MFIVQCVQFNLRNHIQSTYSYTGTLIVVIINNRYEWYYIKRTNLYVYIYKYNKIIIYNAYNIYKFLVGIRSGHGLTGLTRSFAYALVWYGQEKTKTKHKQNV